MNMYCFAEIAKEKGPRKRARAPAAGQSSMEDQRRKQLVGEIRSIRAAIEDTTREIDELKVNLIECRRGSDPIALDAMEETMKSHKVCIRIVFKYFHTMALQLPMAMATRYLLYKAHGHGILLV